MAQLEQALEWRTGSVDAVLSGGEPRLIEEEEQERKPRDPRDPLMVQIAAAYADPSTTPAERRYLLQQLEMLAARPWREDQPGAGRAGVGG